MTTTGIEIQTIQHPLAFRLLRVRGARWLTPRMVRVTLEGAALAGFRSEGADDGSRLFFPADPGDGSWAPIVEGTKLIFPEDQPAPPGREYTPRRYDPEAGELDFDFVVHGDGPASAWAANAAPGHLLGVSGPRRSRVVAGDVDWYLLAGDETSLPAIARRLEELPAGMRAVAVIEVADAREEQPIERGSAAELELIWLHRAAAGADLSELLAGAIRRLEFPRGKVFAWGAGEASSMRQLRRHLLSERGLPPEQARVTGYWKRAIANYDHHQPLEG
ncbi:MAG TPA: siderophore-interacting protein [Thermomicrobiaceae bacterium]|nr:siderophore-interacting protein [Thermomicrobiaceae bacterium]